MHISFGSISLVHRITISTGLFIIDRPFLLSIFCFTLPIPFSYSLPRISYHFSISLPLFDRISLHSFPIYNATICSLFPLSTFQLSVSFLLVVPLYIYLGTYSSAYSSFVSLAHNCLTTLPP